MKVLSSLLIIRLIFILSLGDATEVNISSIKELVAYAAKSGNVVSMSPGVYPLSDYLTMESMIARHDRKEFQFITFSEKDNEFKLDGVEI